MLKQPYLIIVGTKPVVQTYRERMYALTTVEFDLNEIGQTVTDLLQQTDRYPLWAIQHREMYEDIQNELSTETDEVLKMRLIENRHEHDAFGDMMKQLYVIFTQAGFYQQDGVMRYGFHHWMDDDMVLCLVDDLPSYDTITHRT